MAEFLDNKYVFWIVTGIFGFLIGLVITLMRKRQAEQEKRLEKVEANAERERERVNEVISQMPIQYTLRDEFLRVVSDMARRADKTNDALNAMSADVSAIKTAITSITGGVSKHGN